MLVPTKLAAKMRDLRVAEIFCMDTLSAAIDGSSSKVGTTVSNVTNQSLRLSGSILRVQNRAPSTGWSPVSLFTAATLLRVAAMPDGLYRSTYLPELTERACRAKM
jgi:hypothetical protein